MTDRAARRLLAATELDRDGARELAASIEAWPPTPPTPRRYPGYPTRHLPRVHPRAAPSLDETLRTRRARRPLTGPLPDAEDLARLLAFSHGVWADQARGPTPSSGGMQSLELYLVVLEPGWLEVGVHHYQRAEHQLARLRAGATHATWTERLPSLHDLGAPPLLLVAVGDVGRLEGKYGARAARLLLLEAGHLMQNLCLVAASCGLSTVPLGGVLEGAVAHALDLPRQDAVLYAGACGRPAAAP